MAKDPNYWISEVKYDEDHTKIIKLKVHKNNNNTIGTFSIWARENVISDIENNIIFMTAYKKNGKWTKGATVLVVELDNEKFLKTESNNKKVDNLGELPEFK